MTLISTFQLNGCPVLIGDLMLSGQISDTNNFVFPTKQVLNKPPQICYGNDLVGLCQKANLLSPRLAIAWAGSREEAINFYSQVIGAGIERNPSLASLTEIYNDLDNPNALSLIGMLKNDNGTQTFWMNSKEISISNSPFQKIVVAGSGKEDFESLLTYSTALISNGTPNILENAIGNTIGVFSGLLASEISTSKPLTNLYGGGYEIIHPLGDHFEKFSDLTYVFWKICIQDKTIESEITPYLVLKYSYFEDLLVIRGIQISNRQVVNDDLHIVKPIFSLRHEIDFSLINPSSLNSKYICSIFETEIDDKPYSFSQFGRFSPASRPIIFDEKQSELGIDINVDYYKSSILKFIQGLFT